MRKMAVLLAALLAAVFALGTAMAAPPDKVTIKEIQKTKGPVTFDHKAHSGKMKCNACHHKSDEKGTNAQKCSAADCHGAKAEGKKPDLKESFHKQCKGCHQKEKKGPVKCDDCHKKK